MSAFAAFDSCGMATMFFLSNHQVVVEDTHKLPSNFLKRTHRYQFSIEINCFSTSNYTTGGPISYVLKNNLILGAQGRHIHLP